MKFNDQQLRTIENCLRVAAEKFKENAAIIRTEAGIDKGASGSYATGQNRIAEQFDRQQHQAEELAHIIANSIDRDPEVDYSAYPVPAGMRRRKGIEYGCGDVDCYQCYEPIKTTRQRLVDAIFPPAGTEGQDKTAAHPDIRVKRIEGTDQVECLDCGRVYPANDYPSECIEDCTTGRAIEAYQKGIEEHASDVTTHYSGDLLDHYEHGRAEARRAHGIKD